jgi:hypothetical protein
MIFGSAAASAGVVARTAAETMPALMFRRVIIDLSCLLHASDETARMASCLWSAAKRNYRALERRRLDEDQLERLRAC